MWKQVVGGAILVGLAGWAFLDYQGSTKVISSTASGFNTAVRAFQPPTTATSVAAGA